MARRTKEEAGQTREAILEAAVEVFLRKGVTRTSLQDIALEAGVTRGAIYHNFANKEELLGALLESVRLPDEIMESYFEKSNERDPLELLRNWCERTLVRIIPDKRANRIYTILYHRCEWIEDLIPVIQKEEEKGRRVEGMFRKQFMEASKRGILRDEIDPGQAAYIFSTVTKGMYIRSLACSGRSFEEIPFMEGIEAVLRGMRKP